MRKLLLLLLTVISVSVSAQYQPSGSKVRYINGIGLGTKSDAAFGTVDSLVLYAKADSTLMFKYKGTARALAYASALSGYMLYTDTSGMLSPYQRSYNAVTISGTQTITGAKTFSDYLTVNQRVNIGLGSITGNNISSTISTNGAFVPNSLEIQNSNIKNEITLSGNEFSNIYSTTSSGFDIGINNDSGSVYIVTNNLRRATFDSIGRVGIGKYPETELDVSGGFNVGDGTVKVRIVSSGTSGLLGTASNHPLGFRTNSTIRGRIEINGDLYMDNVYTATVGGTNRDVFVDNTGLLGYVSSFRASKKNIQPIINPDWIYKLNPVTFNYRIKDSAGNYTDSAYRELEYGLVAEEVEQVNKEMVFYDVDSLGKKNLRGVHYSKLIIPILAELKDHKKKLDEQQSIIEDLKKRIIVLENK